MYRVAVLAEHRVLLGGSRPPTPVRAHGSSHRARPGISLGWPDSARGSPLTAGIFDRPSGRVSITTNVALLPARRCGWVKHRSLDRDRRSPPRAENPPAVQRVRAPTCGRRTAARPQTRRRHPDGGRAPFVWVGFGGRGWCSDLEGLRALAPTRFPEPGRAVSPTAPPSRTPAPLAEGRGSGPHPRSPGARPRCPLAPRPRERAAKPPQLAANLWTVRDRFGLLGPYRP